MAIVKIAFRNLSRQKRRSFLLAGAIAFGIMIITMVNGLVGGIIKNAENNFSAMIAAHVFVMNIEYTDNNRLVMKINNDTELKAGIEKLGQSYQILYYQKRTSVFNNATLLNQNESVWRQVDGVDWEQDRFLSEQLEIVAGSLKGMKGSDGIVIGEKTAKKLNVLLGESILIQAETIYGQQNVIEAPIKAIFKEDNLSAGTVYMDKEAVNSLLNMPPGSFNWYGIFLKNFRDQDAATLKLQEILTAKNLKVYPREKVSGKSFMSLFGDLRKDKDKSSKIVIANLNDSMASMKGVFDTIRLVSIFVLIILLMVIMVGLNNTYKIIVWERNREIGTMRALGMQRRSVSRIFLLEATFLALIGTFTGIALATGLLGILSLIAFQGTADFSIFMYRNHLSWSYDFPQLLLSILLVVIMSLLAARSPARKAGKVDPAVALRTTA